ncbi:alpha/beta hydrolase [Sphingobacterium spiritivorum]|uniref:Uncharacterized protein n=1 Tax=Sphingobacterium spiritivorum ATCC 33861 TaxID=525373 RepID=D7VQP7_SPHSI|nr:hypothetical protein [Sphingobacterium spiritivorum]EFK56098.1 hypothetical protein HMPREF0766_13301 [Sphingobacterium spiritivorum ATCC 33861]SUJ10304.1 Uncharacterised protein [Sphingobacterium spiritivorum]
MLINKRGVKREKLGIPDQMAFIGKSEGRGVSVRRVYKYKQNTGEKQTSDPSRGIYQRSLKNLLSYLIYKQ